MARILVVDDEPHVTHVLSFFLGQLDHEVTRAGDGRTALHLLTTQPFDLLITDVDMPQMSGVELVGNHNAVDRLRGVIMLTGRNDFESLANLEARPNLRVMAKPFSPSGIAKVIQELVRPPTVAETG